MDTIRYQVTRTLPNGEVIDTAERDVDRSLLTPANLTASTVDWSADGLPYCVRTWDCLNGWTRVYTRVIEEPVEFASVVIPPDAFGALPASDRLAIVEREYVDLAFVTTTEYDDDPDTSWLEQTDDQMGDGYEEHAQERIGSYQRGDWHMIGVVVEATLTDNDGRTEEFRQSVWGIESDADQSYINEVAQDLTRELVFDLTKFGLEYEWIAQFSDIVAGDLAAQRGEMLALAAD